MIANLRSTSSGSGSCHCGTVQSIRVENTIHIFRFNNYFSSLITPGESCININKAAALDEVSLVTLYRQLHNNHFQYSVKYIDVSF